MVVMYYNLLAYFSFYNIYLGEELNICMCFDVSNSRHYGNLLTIFLQNYYVTVVEIYITDM
jgi:hypothetical protein